MALNRQMVATGTAGRVTKYGTHKDDFPTPPWATRALLKYVIPDIDLKGRTVLEPAAGRGHMADVLEEYGAKVHRYDIGAYRRGKQAGGHDYTDRRIRYPKCDLVITNPPYARADQFVLRGLADAKIGVAMLIQTLWMKGRARYSTIFSLMPPTRVGFFTKLIPATRGKVVQKCPVFMSHSWFYWGKNDVPHGHPWLARGSYLTYIPPGAQDELERPGDYA